MDINERIIKIKKSANIQNDLKPGHDYTITATVHCQQATLDDTHTDGKFDKIYSLELNGDFEVVDDLGQKLIAKTKGSPSQKWRWSVQQLGEDYETIMAMANDHVEEIVNFIKRINN